MDLIDEYKLFLKAKCADEIELKIKEFENYLNKNLKSNIVHDELIDFFDLKLNRPTRAKSFSRYIKTRFDAEKYNKVLDVGAGRIPELSMELKARGYNVFAIDPKLEKTNGITCIKDLFDYEVTSVKEYDLLVGLEPCMATEHIIRSALLNDKAFAISLCMTPHNSLSGKKFRDMNEWWNYLISITDDRAYIEIKKVLGKEHAVIRSK